MQNDLFKDARDHLVRMAMMPGFWQYARQRAVEMEAEQHGFWVGIRAAVAQELKARGFRAPSTETAGRSQPMA